MIVGESVSYAGAAQHEPPTDAASLRFATRLTPAVGGFPQPQAHAKTRETVGLQTMAKHPNDQPDLDKQAKENDSDSASTDAKPLRVNGFTARYPFTRSG